MDFVATKKTIKHHNDCYFVRKKRNLRMTARFHKHVLPTPRAYQFSLFYIIFNYILFLTFECLPFPHPLSLLLIGLLVKLSVLTIYLIFIRGEHVLVQEALCWGWALKTQNSKEGRQGWITTHLYCVFAAFFQTYFVLCPLQNVGFYTHHEASFYVGVRSKRSTSLLSRSISILQS